MARTKRNELVAGLFILGVLALLAVVLALITNFESLGRRPLVYYVEFPQAPGVKVGGEVQLGGVAKGRVTNVETRWKKDEATGTETFSYVLALEVSDEIRLRRDAEVVISSPIIGEGAVINIRNVGLGEAAGETHERPVQGQSATVLAGADEALASMGIRQKQKEEIAQIIEDLRVVTGALRQTAPRVSTTVENMSSLTGDLRQRLPAILDTVQEGATKLKSSATSMEAILSENRDQLKSSVTNVAEMTASAKHGMGTLMTDLSAASRDVRSLIAAGSLNVTDTLVNLRQTSEQLKGASVEIRRAPWRLLYQPDKREADTLNVFDASRNYATAVADLRSTATTLESLAELKKSGLSVDERMMRDMLDRLKAGLQKYDEAESALWRQWGQADK